MEASSCLEEIWTVSEEEQKETIKRSRWFLSRWKKNLWKVRRQEVKNNLPEKDVKIEKGIEKESEQIQKRVRRAQKRRTVREGSAEARKRHRRNLN